MKTKLRWLLMVMAIIILNAQFSILDSTLWEVNQDGSGDFTTIQSAVNNAAGGDSILVYPGRYNETVNYWGKSLHIFSKAITTGNDQYVTQTIIDAGKDDNRVGINENKNTFNRGSEAPQLRRKSGVTVMGSADAYLGGFTITGGRGGNISTASRRTHGGGLLIIE